MIRDALNTSIDTVYNDARPDLSLTPSMQGAELKKVADYAEQLSPIKTAGAVTLSGTPSALPNDVNSCSFTEGVAYLPATTTIGKQVIVIAVSNNIEIRANVSNTAKMFETFNTFVSNVILTTNQMCRFTYIGFGTGLGGAVDGYWKAEKLQTLAASQITITTVVSITTDTLAANGLVQKDRNSIIDNGATNVNITVNGGVDFNASYLKHGTGNITFVQGSGRTLVQVSGTNVLSGTQGSAATISSIGTIDYLKITNL